MPWVTLTSSDFIAALEKSGESEVRAALASKAPWVTHAGRDKIAEEWLKGKEEDRFTNIGISSALREEKTLSLSREANLFSKDANRLAHRANCFALIAAIAAVAAAIIAAIALIKDK
jgi:hypothetical protein